jgi:hypothetical protein
MQARSHVIVDEGRFGAEHADRMMMAVNTAEVGGNSSDQAGWKLKGCGHEIVVAEGRAFGADRITDHVHARLPLGGKPQHKVVQMDAAAFHRPRRSA